MQLRKFQKQFTHHRRICTWKCSSQGSLVWLRAFGNCCFLSPITFKCWRSCPEQYQAWRRWVRSYWSYISRSNHQIWLWKIIFCHWYMKIKAQIKIHSKSFFSFFQWTTYILVCAIWCSSSIIQGGSSNTFLLKSGQLTLEAYEEDCEFADPAGSFKGLRRFKRNCTNFGSLIEKSNMKLMKWEDFEVNWLSYN